MFGTSVPTIFSDLVGAGGQEEDNITKFLFTGSLGGAAVWHLPLAEGAILETRDRIPRRAPGAWSLLLPLPVSLPLSLCV